MVLWAKPRTSGRSNGRRHSEQSVSITGQLSERSNGMRDVQLEYFVSAAEKLSFSQAAEENHVTQPVISQQITALERELGFKLFKRTTHGVQLTEAGLMYYRQIVDILRRLSIAKKDAAIIADGHLGTLRIGLFGSAQTEELRILPEFAEMHRGIHLEFNRILTDNHAHQLRSGYIDAAFTFASPYDKGDDIAYVGCVSKKLKIVCRRDHPLAQRKLLREEDLEGCTLFMSERARFERDENRDAYPKICSAESTRYGDDFDVVLLMVRLNYGIAAATEDLRNHLFDDLTMVEIEGELWRVTEGWAYLRGNRNPALPTLINFVEQKGKW